MPLSPPPSRPRLVRADDGAPSAAGASQPSRRRGWLLPLAVVVALIAGAGWGTASRRAAGLEAQVAELSSQLAAARAEIAARQQHLEALRGAVADVQARVGALRSLAEQTPTAATPAPGEAPSRPR